MQGRTHLLSAVAVSMIGYRLFSHAPILNIHNQATIQISAGIAISAAAIGALAPDLDIPESTLSSKMSIINSKMIKGMLNIISIAILLFLLIKARESQFFVPGILVATYIYLMQQTLSKRLLHYLRIGIQVITILGLFYAYIKTVDRPYLLIGIALSLYVCSKHRGISHTLTVNVFASYTVFYSMIYFNQAQYAKIAAGFFFVGAACHILLNDFFTNSGIPSPLHPLDIPFRYLAKIIKNKRLCLQDLKQSIQIKKYKFIITFETGSSIELGISAIATILILFLVFA